MDHKQHYSMLLAPFASFGIVLNFTIVFLVFRNPIMRHSFGLLSANQAIADAVHCITFLFFVCPILFFENSTMILNSHFVGYILLLSYETSVLTHFIISINRFVAVFAPYHYDVFFGYKQTKYIILLVWIFTVSFATLFYQALCHLYYDPISAKFVFTDSQLCSKIGWYADFLKNLWIVIIICVLDTFTILKMHTLQKRVSSSATEQHNSQSSKREINFLRQTILQGAIFASGLFSYFLVPIYFTNTWIVFFGTIFIWSFTHTADGLIAVIMNPEIKKFPFIC